MYMFTMDMVQFLILVNFENLKKLGKLGKNIKKCGVTKLHLLPPFTTNCHRLPPTVKNYFKCVILNSLMAL